MEVGDAEGQQRSVHPNAEQPEPGVGARHQNFVAPTVGHPGAIGCRPREKAGVGNRHVLDDPVASLEVPPDVEVEHRELQIEGDHAHRDQQAGQGEQLQPAQTQGAGAARRQNRILRFRFRSSLFARAGRDSSATRLISASQCRSRSKDRTAISLTCTADYGLDGPIEESPCRAKSHAQCGQTRFLRCPAAHALTCWPAKSLNKNG